MDDTTPMDDTVIIEAPPEAVEVMLPVTAMRVIGIGRDGSIMLEIKAMVPARTLALQQGITILPQKASGLNDACLAPPNVAMLIRSDALSDEIKQARSGKVDPVG